MHYVTCRRPTDQHKSDIVYVSMLVSVQLHCVVSVLKGMKTHIFLQVIFQNLLVRIMQIWQLLATHLYYVAYID